MLSNTRFLLVACIAGLSPSQDESSPSPDPVALVSEAEKLCATNDVEGAVVLLWRALAAIDRLGPDPRRQSAATTARSLLGKHDPNHEARLQSNALVARRQAALAMMYRRKKWYDTAARRLAVAELYDREVSRKERIAFDKVRSKLTAAPSEATGTSKKLNPLFDRGNTVHVDGPWRLVDDEFLESGAHDGGNVLSSWLSKSTHEDGAIVLEFRPTDAKKDRNAGLVFGAVDRQNYYCARFGAFLANKFDSIEIYRLKGGVETQLAQLSTRNGGRVAESHRFVLHIRGSHLRFQVDDRQPVEADAGAPVRGQLGLCVGVTGYKSCPVQFRRFDVGPLPGAEPTAAELRAALEARARRDVEAEVKLARAEVTSKQLEAASARLRQARSRLRSLNADDKREALAASIETLLSKADRQHKKRAAADRECADALVLLADKYAASDMPRAAFEIVVAAVRFDPLGLAERESRARQAVDAWDAAHAIGLDLERGPTVESGAALRKWFTEGRQLHGQATIRWMVEGPTARVDSLRNGEISVLMPRDGLPDLAKAAIVVRLPSVGAAAGFCVDVAGSHDFAVALLERTAVGLVLSVQRWRNKGWTRLGSAPIELPASKLGGWFEVEIENADKGLAVRAAGKTVVVGAELLGAAAGRYGLVVTNSGEPATIEVAAFRFTK